MKNEAHARIKINQLLEEVGWRFFDNEEGKANILLENHVKISQKEIDTWGNDYEKTKNGSLDFLLVDRNNKPIYVLEAKKESLHPLVAKEQARKYAKTVGAQYVILSNGILTEMRWQAKKWRLTISLLFKCLTLPNDLNGKESLYAAKIFFVHSDLDFYDTIN